jgi:hypothetical protein
MSDLAMYEALAAAALHRCGRDPRRLRRTLAGFEQEIATASTPECRAGFELVATRLREKLATWPELPLDAERSR